MKKYYTDMEGNEVMADDPREGLEFSRHEAESDICFAGLEECCHRTHVLFGRDEVEGFLDESGGDAWFMEFGSWQEVREHITSRRARKNPSIWHIDITNAMEEVADEHSPETNPDACLRDDGTQATCESCGEPLFKNNVAKHDTGCVWLCADCERDGDED